MVIISIVKRKIAITKIIRSTITIIIIIILRIKNNLRFLGLANTRIYRFLMLMYPNYLRFQFLISFDTDFI